MTVRIDPAHAVVRDFQREDVATLTVARGVRTSRAEGVAPVRVVHPNGPDCPPVCRTLSVRLAGNRLVPT